LKRYKNNVYTHVYIVHIDIDVKRYMRILILKLTPDTLYK